MTVRTAGQDRLLADMFYCVDAMHIVLDSSVAGEISVSIARRGRATRLARRTVSYHGAEAISPLLARVCRKFRVRLPLVQTVAVVTRSSPPDAPATCPRPSFTHSRAAAVVGNALAYGLGVPAVTVPAARCRDLAWRIKNATPPARLPNVRVRYLGAPNISQPKQRN